MTSKSTNAQQKGPLKNQRFRFLKNWESKEL